MKSLESERCCFVNRWYGWGYMTHGALHMHSTQLNHVQSSSALHLSICQTSSLRRNLLITIKSKDSLQLRSYARTKLHEVHLSHHRLGKISWYLVALCQFGSSVPLIRAAPLYANNFAEILLSIMTTAAYGMHWNNGLAGNELAIFYSDTFHGSDSGPSSRWFFIWCRFSFLWGCDWQWIVELCTVCGIRIALKCVNMRILYSVHCKQLPQRPWIKFCPH